MGKEASERLRRLERENARLRRSNRELERQLVRAEHIADNQRTLLMRINQEHAELLELLEQKNQALCDLATRLENSLAESRAVSDQLQGLLSHSPSVICTVDMQGRFQFVNRQYERMSGMAADEVRGRCYRDVLPAATSRLLEGMVEKVLLTGEPFTDEVSVRMDGGTSFFMTTLFALTDGRGRPRAMCCIATDVTENRRLQAEAIRAGQLASLGELAAGVAHEINNPLNGVMNYAQIILDDLCGRGERQDVARRIIFESERMAFIVEKLLAFARGQKGRRRPVRVADVLDEALALTGRSLRSGGVALELALPADLPPVMANFYELEQVFLNLITNAVHALDEVAEGPRVLRIEGALRPAGEVRVVFRDSGPGVRRETMEHIFDPFFSTRDESGGTGLGLSICQRIVQDHGGRLSAESEPDRFTAMTVELPAAGQVN
jgi:PAS domain S-box-containing protein